MSFIRTLWDTGKRYASHLRLQLVIEYDLLYKTTKEETLTSVTFVTDVEGGDSEILSLDHTDSNIQIDNESEIKDFEDEAVINNTELTTEIFDDGAGE